MAWTMPVNALIEITFKGSQFGQTVMNLFHYKFVGTSGLPDGAAALARLLEEIETGVLYPAYVSCLSDQVTGIQLFAQMLYPTRYARVSRSPVSGTGEVTGDCMPSNVSCTFIRRGDIAGGHGHGTIHLPGVPVDWVTNGEMNADAVTPGNDFVAAVKAELTPQIGETYIPMIYNRSSPAASVPVTGAERVIDTRTMRRRSFRTGV